MRIKYSTTKKCLLLATLLVGVLFGAAFFHRLSSAQPDSQLAATQSPSAPADALFVSALGRLEPEGRVIRLTAATGMEGARVARILVAEGDVVRAGQIVAILDNHETQRATVEAGERQLEVARMRLAQSAAGGKRSEIAAQEAVLSRLEVELRHARTELRRSEPLHASGDIPTRELNERQLAVETLAADVARARASLISLSEVRQVDVNVAQAEVESARAAVARERVVLENTYIHALTDGRALKIHARPGEAIGPAGLLELGETGRMCVVAEVYEADIQQVRKGQRAVITIRSTRQTLNGAVEQVGLQIGKRDILDADPVADVDARVVEVRIRLDAADSGRVAHLTNLRVDARIAVAEVEGGK
jgi:HlyD family secretion protein